MNLPGQGSGLNHPATDRSVVGAALTEAVRDGTASAGAPSSAIGPRATLTGHAHAVQVADPASSAAT